MSRAIKTTPEMAQEMATEREKSGYNKKLYKVLILLMLYWWLLRI